MCRHASPAMVLLLGVITAPVIEGCARQADSEPKEHTVRKVPVETPAPKPEAASEKETSALLDAKDKFERTLNEHLKRLDKEIRELQTKVANLQESVKAEWTEKLTEVAAKRKAAEAKLEEVRKAAAGAWEHLREGADRSWEELERAVEKARKELPPATSDHASRCNVSGSLSPPKNVAKTCSNTEPAADTLA